MTVCLAAIARFPHAIVTVIDTKLSNNYYSHDFGAMKIRALKNRWSIMYSGDPDQFEKLQRHINGWLDDHSMPKDVDSVIKATEEAYAKELERLVNREVLSPFGLTLETFRNAPAKQFRPEMYLELIQRIDALSKDRGATATDLILCGFDSFGDPHLVYVSQTGECAEQFNPGYCIIGSGEPLARAYLQAHDTFLNSPRLGEVVYRMQAAKFAAEKSPPVTDKNTITTVFHSDGRIFMNYDAKEAREYYNDERTRFPEDVAKRVESSLTGGWQYSV